MSTQPQQTDPQFPGEKKDYTGPEAIEKIRELAEGKVCHFGTYKGPYHLDARPMYTQQVDEAGDIWFLSSKDSNKDQQLDLTHEVDLLYANTSDSQYLHLRGNAEETRSPGKIDELWSEFVKTWFPAGKDDPNLVAIRVRPFDVYYWDTQHGKVVSFLKVAYSTITGDRRDDSVEGHLSV